MSVSRQQRSPTHTHRFDLLLGRRTYDIWSGFWQKAPSSPMADGLGTGKHFFAERTPARAFELVSTKAFPSGIILSTYKVAGPLKTG